MIQKITIRALLVCLLVSVMPLSGCKNEYSDSESATKVMTLMVASQFTTYVPWSSDVPVKCLKVKFDGQKEWTTLTTSEIEGFDYQSGYEWVLKVEREKLSNPPADASCYRYTLLKVVSKTETRHTYSKFLDDVTFRVDCSEESRAAIEADLAARVIPQGTRIILFNESYACVEEPEATYEGLLYRRSYSAGSVVMLLYNGKTYEFTLSDNYLIQDLTADYSARYPDAKVTRVVWGMRSHVLL